MDETYIKIKGIWNISYRAVDKEGKTVDFFQTAKRDNGAAMPFFEKVMQDNDTPEKVSMVRVAPTKQLSIELLCQKCLGRHRTHAT